MTTETETQATTEQATPETFASLGNSLRQVQQMLADTAETIYAMSIHLGKTLDRDNALTVKASMLRPLNGDAALEEHGTLIAGLESALTYKCRAEMRLRAAKLHLEEARSLVLLNGLIDGKNEATRNAQLTLALRDDPDYQAALQDVNEAENDLDYGNTSIEITRRKLDANKARLSIISGSLALLAS